MTPPPADLRAAVIARRCERLPLVMTWIAEHGVDQPRLAALVARWATHTERLAEESNASH
jgi:hypothetical protein